MQTNNAVATTPVAGSTAEPTREDLLKRIAALEEQARSNESAEIKLSVVEPRVAGGKKALQCEIRGSKAIFGQRMKFLTLIKNADKITTFLTEHPEIG